MPVASLAQLACPIARFVSSGMACNLNIRRNKTFDHWPVANHAKTTVSPRLPELAGAVGGSTAVLPRGHGARPHARRRARRNGPNSPRSAKPRKVLILGAGISGLTAAYELNKQGLRGAGARGLVPRRRPQHDRAQRRSHRRDRLSAGLQLRQGPGPLLQLRSGAHSRATTSPARTTARSSASSSRPSSTTTATPGCRTTRCSAASRSARANT